MKAVPDELPLPHGKGRLILKGLRDAPGQILQGVQRAVHLLQPPLGESGQQLPYGGQLFHGGPQGHHVPAPGAAVDDAAHEPLHVAYAAQGQHQLLPGNGVADQPFHAVGPAVNVLHAEQRALQPAAEHPRAHGGSGLVQHPQQAAFFLLAAQGLRQLQVAPGGNVQLHELALVIVVQCVNVGQVALLRVVQVAQKVAQRQHHGGIFPGQLRELLLPELGCHQRPGGLLLRLTHLPVAGELLLRQHPQRRVLGGLFVQDDLRRGKPRHLVEKVHGGVGAGKGCGVGLSGGDVAGGKASLVLLQPHGGAEVAAPGLQRGITQHCAGGHHPDDVPLDQSLGGGGILRLLANGHLVALGDEPGDIPVGGMVGDAAHGHLFIEGLVLVLVPGGKGQIQLPGGGSGVCAEHFVKVTQTEKQDGILVLFLDFQILLHHGSQLSHSLSHLSAAWAAHLI